MVVMPIPPRPWAAAALSASCKRSEEGGGRREEGGGRREEGGVGSDAQVLTLLIVTPLQALTLRTHARACLEAITYEGSDKAVGGSSKGSLRFSGFQAKVMFLACTTPMETLGGSARRKVLVTAVIRCRTCRITRDQRPGNCEMKLQLAG
jgi:hypothetical protein